LEVAWATHASYPDGVWLIDFVPIGDPGSVPQALAGALELRAAGTAPDLITEHLRDRQPLLFLDNCEPLLDACASLAASLLRTWVGRQFVATSREVLSHRGRSCRGVAPAG